MRRYLPFLLLVACSHATSFDSPDASDSGKPADAGRDGLTVAPDSGDDAGITDSGPDTYVDPGSGRCVIGNDWHSCPAMLGDPATFFVCTMNVNGPCGIIEKCQDFVPPCPYGRTCQLWFTDGGVVTKQTGTCL